MVARVCVSVCLSVPRRIPTLLHRPGCILGNGRRFPFVVHYWGVEIWRTFSSSNVKINRKLPQTAEIRRNIVLYNEIWVKELNADVRIFTGSS